MVVDRSCNFLFILADGRVKKLKILQAQKRIKNGSKELIRAEWNWNWKTVTASKVLRL